MFRSTKRAKHLPDQSNVLVVDNSKALGYSIAQRLKTEIGAVAHCAHSAADLERLLASNTPFDLAICGLSIAGAANGEAIDILDALGIPVIVFTASFDQSTRERFLKRRLVDYVLKDNDMSIAALIASARRALTNHQIKILVVDDSKSKRALLTAILRSKRYNVTEARSGDEALERLQESGDIKLVISDYLMPKMDGYELTKHIRRIDAAGSIRVIGLSASANRQISAGFLKAGADDFLSYPFVEEELQCRIENNVDTLRLLEELRDRASKDYLTGLFNRRHLFEVGPRILSQAHQGGTNVAVALLDIDHFKRINDTHGHEFGDTALKAVSRCLQQEMKLHSGLVARVGGEEFVILFNGASESEARRISETIRQAVSEIELSSDELPVPLSVSIGVAGQAESFSLEEQLNQADKYLYVAKAGGRNRVCSRHST